jgi:23S rRNA (adenine1618-N6)-methyltransferase
MPKDPIKKEPILEKVRLHPRNKHRERYDFALLTKIQPELVPLISKNKYGDVTIDFSDPMAVKALNTALLKQYYDIKEWDIPDGFLCPPIPGRADYIHNVADLLSQLNYGAVPKGPKIKCLDIGIGASCIYPIIGVKEYNWSFIGSEIDDTSVQTAERNISSNPLLQDFVTIRQQPKAHKIFKNIIKDAEYFDISICNPPFHGSELEANEGSQRKIKNLKLSKSVLNFGGKQNELWCEGGEDGFVQQMIAESHIYKQQCLWFTTLISKQSNLKRAYQALERIGVYEHKTIPMGQGNKTSRILAWTYLSNSEQKNWAKLRWQDEKDEKQI